MKMEITQNLKQGLEFAKELLYKNVDKKTALFLSGGETQKPLYETLAKEKKLHVGAVAMVDERFGLHLHSNSNERMVRGAGLLDYLAAKNIPFYSVLRTASSHPEFISGSDEMLKLVQHVKKNVRRHLEGVSITAKEYDKRVKELFSSFPKRVAIMGVGEDGHIASLPAGTKNLKLRTKNYVTEISDFPGEFRERITLTFKALSQMDILIVLVFGEKKKRALELMFKEGPIEEIPARFYKRPNIAKKTILITDQKV